MQRRDLLRSAAAVAAGVGMTRAASAAERGTSGAFVETRDGVRIFYKDWGAGRPVVFCHGGVLGADMWEYQMTALAAAGLRCIAHDRRGCARSGHPGRGYDFDTFADDLNALLD